MAAIDGRVPDGAREITTGQTNRVWYIDGPVPYVLMHYSDPNRAANEATALALLTMHGAPAPELLRAGPGDSPAWTAQTAIHAEPVPASQLLHELAGPLAAVHRITDPIPLGSPEPGSTAPGQGGGGESGRRMAGRGKAVRFCREPEESGNYFSPDPSSIVSGVCQGIRNA
ncbi:phosphotransferase [Streptomyces sp. NPDC058770]|uniref:phosphotransferase n=1 Tax=Streptomyces sp. NPDC058770 TaxID=3346631 RepID=UPI003681E9D4